MGSPNYQNLPYSEQQIRGLALNFLRGHYRLRPRSGTSGTRAETRKQFYNGVTIDALLAYQKPDLTWFTATVEATSVDRADEVLYRVNWFRIWMHALLIGLFITVIILAGMPVRWWVQKAVVGKAQFFLLIPAFLATLTGLFALCLSRLPYYRYIFAVAQFQRFYAEAQWIAYDRVIFPLHDTDRPGEDAATRRHNAWLRDRYEELVRQVTRFGFGLLEVREEGKVRWIIEPSHTDQFRGKRGELPPWLATLRARPAMKRLKFALPFGGGARPPAPGGGRGTPPKTTPAPASAPPPLSVSEGEIDPLAVPRYLPSATREYDYAAVTPAAPGRPKIWRRPGKQLLRLRWRLRNALRARLPEAVRTQVGYYTLPRRVVVVLTVLGVAFIVLFWMALNRETLARPNQRDAAPPATTLESGAPAAEDPLLPGEYDHTLRSDQLGPEDEALSTPRLEGSLDGDEREVDRWSIDEDGGVTREFRCLSFALLTDKYYLVQAGRYPDFSTARLAAVALHRRTGLAVTVSRTSCVRVGGGGYLTTLGKATKDPAVAAFTKQSHEGSFGLELDVIETNPANY